MRPKPVVATKGCASWPSMKKVGAGGVGRQRNGLVDNELTRLTPCAKPSCKVGAGGALAQGIAESISACPDGSYATRIRTMPENHIEFFTMVRHFFWRILIIQGCN